jgi:hypothetical protein
MPTRLSQSPRSEQSVLLAITRPQRRLMGIEKDANAIKRRRDRLVEFVPRLWRRGTATQVFICLHIQVEWAINVVVDPGVLDKRITSRETKRLIERDATPSSDDDAEQQPPCPALSSSLTFRTAVALFAAPRLARDGAVRRGPFYVSQRASFAPLRKPA